MQDERQYPVTCGEKACGPLSYGFIASTLTDDVTVLEKLAEKKEEYEMPPIRRTYCSNQSCIAAIGYSKSINLTQHADGTQVICPDCKGSTCRRCRGFMGPSGDHVCSSEEHNAEVLKFLDTLAESERWLWQKCWACAGWVEKESECLHMTCMCSAEFCLVCGREWVAGQHNCSHGCPHYEEPVYDSDGSNQHGSHRDTGLNRTGNPFDPCVEDSDDDGRLRYERLRSPKLDIHGYDINGLDLRGFDVNRYDVHGYDELGFDRHDRDRLGFNVLSFDAEGYHRDGFDRLRKDREGSCDDGHDIDGFTREGISFTGTHRAEYDGEGFDGFGFDGFGFDVWGFNRAGFDRENRDGEGYDFAGLDRDGFSREGYDVHGFDKAGFNRFGCDAEGYRRSGYDSRHRNRQGDLHPRYELAPDSNPRPRCSEGLSAEVMECAHETGWVPIGTTCYVCRWTSDIFHYRCQECEATLCRACNSDGVEWQRSAVRCRYMFPGADSFGVREMFEAAEGETRAMHAAGDARVADVAAQDDELAWMRPVISRLADSLHEAAKARR